MKCENNSVSVVCKGQALAGCFWKSSFLTPLSLRKKSIFSANLDKLPSTPLTLIGIPFHFFFFRFFFCRKNIIRREEVNKIFVFEYKLFVKYKSASSSSRLFSNLWVKVFCWIIRVNSWDTWMPQKRKIKQCKVL